MTYFLIEIFSFCWNSRRPLNSGPKILLKLVPKKSWHWERKGLLFSGPESPPLTIVFTTHSGRKGVLIYCQIFLMIDNHNLQEKCMVVLYIFLYPGSWKIKLNFLTPNSLYSFLGALSAFQLMTLSCWYGKTLKVFWAREWVTWSKLYPSLDMRTTLHRKKEECS